MAVVKGTQEGAERLAALVFYERDEVLHLSQQTVCDRAGFTDKTLYKIENATQTGYSTDTLRGLATALGWKLASVKAVLKGEADEVEREPDQEQPRFYPLPGSTSTPPDTELPSYEIEVNGITIWLTTGEPEWRTMTPEQRVERMRDRVNRQLPPAP